jgi:pimeloyl-ACP methyl ester carboxylesterase
MGIADISLCKIENHGNPVVGLLYTPEGNSSLAVVLSHGYSGSKQDMAPLAQALCAEGYFAFTVDARGHRLGGTGGYLHSLDDVAEDLEKSVRFVKKKTQADKIVVCGHSMSGAAAARTAAVCEDVDALILLGNGLRPMAQDLPPEAIRLVGTRSKYVDGISGLDIRHQVQLMLREYIGKLDSKPVLIVSGSSDTINSEQRCKDLLAMTKGPKSLVVVDADHFRIPLRAAEPVVEWLRKLN